MQYRVVISAPDTLSFYSETFTDMIAACNQAQAMTRKLPAQEGSRVSLELAIPALKHVSIVPLFKAEKGGWEATSH